MPGLSASQAALLAWMIETEAEFYVLVVASQVGASMLPGIGAREDLDHERPIARSDLDALVRFGLVQQTRPDRYEVTTLGRSTR